MLINVPIGIMQGRLSNKLGQELQSFPHDQWRDEFMRASAVGYTLIEWLIDAYDNPISVSETRAEIISISERYNIGIRSLCAHVFMNGDLISEGRKSVFAKNYLNDLLRFSEDVGIEFVVLPLMDNMSLKLNNNKEILCGVLSEVISSTKVTILLESDLIADELKDFIEYVGAPQIGVLYDLGNANALEFNIQDDLLTLGDLIKEIHVKDRMLGNGPSKRLGYANTPFEDIAITLNTMSWNGPLILETPIYNDWKSEAVHNLEFVEKWLNKV